MLAMSQKATFFNQLNQLVINESLKPSTVIQFKNEAQKRLQSNEIEGYLALGTLARLEGNVEAVHDNHQRALAAMTTQQAYALSLYAKCLVPFGFFGKAAKLMLNAYNLSKNTIDLEDAIEFYRLAGHFHQVGELLKRWELINPDSRHRGSQQTEALIQFLDNKQVSDADLEGLIQLAMSILRQHHQTIAPEKIEIDLLSDEHSQWFHYGIVLYESVEKVVEMNNELADRSVEECPSQIIQGGFVPIFKAMKSGVQDLSWTSNGVRSPRFILDEPN
jgi:hypothetical protein